MYFLVPSSLNTFKAPTRSQYAALEKFKEPSLR